MILFKSACKNIRHNFFVHVVIVLQMIATIVITMIMVSSILIRYQYYTPFKEFFQSKGFYCIFSEFANGDLENWRYYNQNTASEEEQYHYFMESMDKIYMDGSEMQNYFDDAKSIAACHTVLAYPADESQNCRSISYSDSIIENYAPALSDGRWLHTSADATELEVVISENDYGWKVGDTIPINYSQYPNGLSTTVKVVGILKDGVEIPGSSARDGTDTFQLFYETYSYEIAEEPLMIFSSDSIEKLTDVWGDDQKILQAVNGSVIITFPEDTTKEEMENIQHQLTSLGCAFSIPLQDMNANSMGYLYAQVYNLLPIIIVLMILTIVSSISSSALSVKERLKDYSIYYICGLRWRQCVFINMIESAVLAIISILISCALLVLLQFTALSDHVKIIWNPISVASLLCIVILYILLSMLMPIMIIGKNTPKQILTK